MNVGSMQSLYGHRLASFVFIVAIALFALLLFVLVGGEESCAEEYDVGCQYAGGFGGAYQDVVYDGEYLYATHVQGLSIFNVSDPSDPERVGFIHTTGYARSVAVSGDCAYVATSDYYGNNGSLVIVDISDPKNPTKEGHIITEEDAYSVAVSGDYAFVATSHWDIDTGSSLVIVEMGDKKNPTIAGHYDTAGRSRGVTLSGDFAFVADGPNGLVILDISNPKSPTMKGHYDTAGYAWNVAVSGNYAFVTDWDNGLVIVNISDKKNPTKEGHYDTTDRAFDVLVSGDYAYVANGSNGLAIVDINNPENPITEGFLNTTGTALGVAVSGGFAYIADDSNGLVIVNISDKKNPTKDAHYVTAGQTWSIAVSGEYAFVTDSYTGLVIVNITDKENPTKEGHFVTGGFARGMAMSGDYAFVADGYNGLVIVNISDKKNPTKEGHYDTADFARDVTVSGDYAYVADGHTGLVIVNITDPKNPTKEGYYDFDEGYYDMSDATAVAVSGDYAFVADSNYGLVIVNITDKRNPTKEAWYDTNGHAKGVAVIGDYVFVADGSSGLLIMNISDKKNPTEEGKIYIGSASNAWDLVVNSDYAFVADGPNGLVIINISDMKNPTKEGHYDTNDRAHAVAVSSDYAFVTDFENGLIIVEMGPMAHIDSSLPRTALDVETVSFKGHGTCLIDRTIQCYAWRSSLDGELHNDTTSDFDTDELTIGEHTIYFKIQDDRGIWSDEVSDIVIVTEKPIAYIDSISPNPALDTDNISFVGHGADDGTIARYAWHSSLDGELHNDSTSDFDTKNLTIGEHTIYFKVQDEYGVWSDDASSVIQVKTDGKNESYNQLAFVAIILLMLTVPTIAAIMSEALRYRLLQSLLPLYSRISEKTIEKDVGQQNIRGKIFQHIKDNPGVNFTSLMKSVAAGSGTTVYHLSVLQREGYIRSSVNGNRKLFWVKNEFPGTDRAALTDIQQVILELLGKNGRMSWSELVLHLDASKPTVHKHIRELEKKKIVAVESERNSNYCTLMKEDMEYV